MSFRCCARALIALLVLVSTLGLQPKAVASPDSYYPSGYAIGGSTSWLSGDVLNLTAYDGVYMAFGSYYSGTDASDFVDNSISDVDSSADKGTHSNFSAQQVGLDSTYDTLTEENTSGSGENWLSGWDKRVKITINSTDIDAPLANFPVLIHLSNSSSGESDEDVSFIFDEIGSNNKKIAVTTGDGTTQCYVEIEKWDDPREKAWLWVRVPSVSNTTDTDLYLYYDADQTNNTYYVGDTGSTVAKNVWDSNYVAVWHLGEDPSTGSEPRIKDATSNPADMTTYGAMTSYDLIDAKIDGGIDFDGTDDNFEADAAKLDLTGTEVTLEAWVRIPTGGVNNDEAIIVKANSTNAERYMLGIADSSNETDLLNGRITNSGGTHYRFDVAGVPRGAWTYIVVRYDGTRLNGYVDGALLSGADISASGNIGTADSDILRSGRRLDDRWYEGDIDEIRISNVSRSTAWIKANCESGKDQLIDFGSEEFDGTANYELDLEIQWINVTYGLSKAELCILGGTMGSEDIRVDVWSNSTWHNLFSDLSSGWNNVSVSSYLNSPTFAIRFGGGNETSDTFQDSWNVDVTLLHTWSNEYTTEVEFTGLSDTETWTRLEWSVDSAWTVDSVNVTLQLYNYSLGDYTTNGNGYVSYASSAIANTHETKNQTITVNLTYFRDSTGYWKMKVKGVKITDVPFDFKADLIKYEINFASPSKPFDWAILYALLLVFGIVFISAAKLNRKKKTDAFSELFGMTHQQMIGKKMLLEIDPTSDYHKALLDFASEAKNSGEPLFIFTSTNSALHSALPGAENVRFFLLTSNVSSFQQINEKVTLLPAHNLSLLLNASVEALKDQKEKPTNMLFDNISDIIISCGFEKTYDFLHLLHKAISSSKATALFVFNPAAHDPAIISSIRELFQNRMFYTKGGPRVETQ